MAYYNHSRKGNNDRAVVKTLRPITLRPTNRNRYKPAKNRKRRECRQKSNNPPAASTKSEQRLSRYDGQPHSE